MMSLRYFQEFCNWESFTTQMSKPLDDRLFFCQQCQNFKPNSDPIPTSTNHSDNWNKMKNIEKWWWYSNFDILNCPTADQRNNLHQPASGIRHMNLKMMECKSLKVVAKVCEHYNGDSQVRPREVGTRGNLSKIVSSHNDESVLMSHPRLLGQNNSCLFLPIVKVLFFRFSWHIYFLILWTKIPPSHSPSLTPRTLKISSTLMP